MSERNSRRVKEDIRTGEGVVDGASTFAEVMEVSGMSELLEISVEALDTDNESIDPSFDLDESMKSDTDYLVDNFCEDWVLQTGPRGSSFLRFIFSFSTTKACFNWSNQSSRTCWNNDRKINDDYS